MKYLFLWKIINLNKSILKINFLSQCTFTTFWLSSKSIKHKKINNFITDFDIKFFNLLSTFDNVISKLVS